MYDNSGRTYRDLDSISVAYIASLGPRAGQHLRRQVGKRVLSNRNGHALILFAYQDRAKGGAPGWQHPRLSLQRWTKRASRWRWAAGVNVSPQQAAGCAIEMARMVQDLQALVRAADEPQMISNSELEPSSVNST